MREPRRRGERRGHRRAPPSRRKSGGNAAVGSAPGARERALDQAGRAHAVNPGADNRLEVVCEVVESVDVSGFVWDRTRLRGR